MVVVATLKSLGLGESLPQEEEEEEGADECCLCLEILAVGVGAALVYGHRFHMGCMGKLVGHYRDKGLDALCPYSVEPSWSDVHKRSIIGMIYLKTLLLL